MPDQIDKAHELDETIENYVLDAKQLAKTTLSSAIDEAIKRLEQRVVNFGALTGKDAILQHGAADYFVSQIVITRLAIVELRSLQHEILRSEP